MSIYNKIKKILSPERTFKISFFIAVFDVVLALISIFIKLPQEIVYTFILSGFSAGVGCFGSFMAMYYRDKNNK